MYTFQVWVRINQLQTVHVRIPASSGYEAKLIAESQYGEGSVLHYTQLDE